MQARRILSMLLALALMVSVIAPCSNIVHAAEVKTLYGDELEQVTEPVIGESYYLGADVGGTMMYFRHGTISDTVPYSLVVTDDITHNWAFPLTVEDPTETVEAYTEGFQLTYTHPKEGTTARIYCMDVLKDATVAGQTGVMDTGANGTEPYKNRHNFYINDLDGLKLITSTGNGNVLVIKQIPQTTDGETTDAWRMLGVPVEELANDGVYPVMLLKKHTHTYGAETLDAAAGTASRTCTTCGRTAVVHCQTQEQVKYPVIGETYNLVVNVEGEILSFTTGGYTQTSPQTLITTTDVKVVTVQAALESGKGEFQLVYNNGTDDYSVYSIAAGLGLSKSAGYVSDPVKVSFSMEEVNGEYVLRAYGTQQILAAKYSEAKAAWRIFPVADEEIGTDGVYPVMLTKEHAHDYTTGKPQGDKTGHTEACWCGALGTKTAAHTFGAPTTSGVVTSRSCVVCDYVDNTYNQMEQVDAPVAGNSYYLAANVKGVLKYFTTGTVTTTAPYSLVTTESEGTAEKVTLENSTETNENFEGGFQFTFDNDGTVTRIYCMDVLKDATTAGQTGIMDTGTNAATPYKNRHSFWMDEVNGVKVLRKYGNDNILVVKYFDTTETYRMLGVPEAELANEGVYPVMVLQEHTHEKGNTITQITDAKHGYGCWCGGVAQAEDHTYGASTHNTTAKTTTRACTVCGYTAAVHGHSQAQVKHPVIGETYNLVVNVEGEILSFTTGGYTQTSPQTLITTTDVKVVTVQAALESGKGEFQLVYNNGTDDYSVYSIAAGLGLSKSASYVSDPLKVSFSMEEVNGEYVLRAYGTQEILAAKYSEAKAAWRIFPVADEEIGTNGVYPVMLTVEHTQHTYDDTWLFDKEAGTQSHVCVACGGAPTGTLHGTGIKASQVTAPVTDGTGTYYLGANVAGTLKFFTTGTVTNTVPYSLVTTERDSVAVQVTLENSTATSENFEGGFQLTFINPSNDTLARIYCMDVLKDETTAGQTGIMDTGTNSTTPYKNRHSFWVDEVNGVKVLRKYGNDNILVVKLLDSTGTYRMLGVPEAELANEGVYPVMLLNLHEHVFGEEIYSEESGHYHLCDCESKSAVISHSFGDWTLDRENQKQTATCEVCDYTLTTASPYLDTLDSQEELNNSLAQTVADETAQNGYAVSGGKDYYLMAEIGDDFYYFRNVGKTAGGNSEGTSSTAVTGVTGHSLYTTNDPSHDNIIKTKVTAGNTENTYVIYAGEDIHRVVYINDESTDGAMDTGLTAFRGISNNATYKARSEFMWDEENAYLYQEEEDVKYVLVMKQMTASYNSGAETGTEWRMVAVPVAEATPEQGNYPVVLVNHVHNLEKQFQSENGTHYRACGCGYKATVKTGIVLGESVGVNFDVKLEAGETVTATVAGSEASVQLTEKGGNTYAAFVPLAAAQMTDEVKICVGGDLLDVPFTVRAFADAILADESYNQYAKDLMNHMLVYGSAAQNYFGYNTGNLAGDGIDVSVSVPAEAVGVAVQSDLEGVEFYGASVVHEGRTAVRFYFTAASVEGLTFTVDGNVYEPVKKDDMYYIEVGGINPQNLNQDMTAVVSNGEQNLAVQYSPLTYIIRTYNRADAPAALKDLVKAMYGYHTATKTYIANMYLGNDFALKSQTVTSLYEGVDQYASTYVAAGHGEVKAYAIVIDAAANVELKVSAGTWSASSTAENPGETKTVVKHFRDMKSAGSNVLAMINGGFFDLNSGKTMKPYGMQIVDGVVKQAPAAGNYSDNWFGMTKDGKYVISNAEGYQNTYINNVQQGVGGGKLLMIGGQVQNLTSDRDYRTAVGVNADGDLVLVAVENATYNDVCQIFVDLNMEIVTVLNLDGGGSTAMYVPGAFYPKALILGEDGLLPREVADAVGIVVKP